jgi:AmmeMemoRadiSam system protein B
MSEWIVWLYGLAVLVPAAGWMVSGKDRRALGPAVAGTWYPGDGPSLARAVDDLLDSPVAEPHPHVGRVLALIEPHAGYVYSGQVAGKGFSGVRGMEVSRVILIGPSHYEAFTGARVPEADAYRTPLGEVELDGEGLESLASRPGIETSDRPFRQEHCLESEIPFLQRALAPGWRLLPVLVGSGTSGESAQQIADALRPLLDASTLVVVSSDFTHYGPRFGYVPFHDDIPQRIRGLDMGAVERIRRRDVSGFESYLRETGATICGRDAIGVLMRLLPEDVEVELTAYDTSGSLTGDWEHSVSYASMTFRRAGTDTAWPSR